MCKTERQQWSKNEEINIRVYREILNNEKKRVKEINFIAGVTLKKNLVYILAILDKNVFFFILFLFVTGSHIRPDWWPAIFDEILQALVREESHETTPRLTDGDNLDRQLEIPSLIYTSNLTRESDTLCHKSWDICNRYTFGQMLGPHYNACACQMLCRRFPKDVVLDTSSKPTNFSLRRFSLKNLDSV